MVMHHRARPVGMSPLPNCTHGLDIFTIVGRMVHPCTMEMTKKSLKLCFLMSPCCSLYHSLRFWIVPKVGALVNIPEFAPLAIERILVPCCIHSFIPSCENSHLDENLQSASHPFSQTQFSSQPFHSTHHLRHLLVLLECEADDQESIGCFSLILLRAPLR